MDINGKQPLATFYTVATNLLVGDYACRRVVLCWCGQNILEENVN